MDNIRTYGLMTKAERTQGNVVAASKGAVFGDGIYTANNCKNFSNFGPAGLIVARLQGKAVRAASYLPPSKLTGIEAHTIIGDKMTGAGSGVDKDGWPTSDSYHEIVLRHSSQCLPMIKFDRALISNKDGEACLQFIEKSLKEIINKLFNKGVQPNNVQDAQFIVPPVQRRYATVPAPGQRVPLPLPPTLPASLAARMGLVPGVTGATLPLPGMPGVNNLPPLNGMSGVPLPRARSQSKRRKKTSSAAVSMANARSYTAPTMTTQTLKYTAPASLTLGVPDNALTSPPMSCNLDDDCVICMEKLKKRRKCAALPCKHVFHKQCLELAFKSKPQCPVCRISVGEAQGKSPSGTMTVFVSPIRCSGFNEDSITITYNMPSGTQMSYHDNPNTRHSSKFVSAYLPMNNDGRELLKRLKFAFMHGLTFTVGTSATSGQTNQITW